MCHLGWIKWEASEAVISHEDECDHWDSHLDLLEVAESSHLTNQSLTGLHISEALLKMNVEVLQDKQQCCALTLISHQLWVQRVAGIHGDMNLQPKYSACFRNDIWAGTTCQTLSYGTVFLTSFMNFQPIKQWFFKQPFTFTENVRLLLPQFSSAKMPDSGQWRVSTNSLESVIIPQIMCFVGYCKYTESRNCLHSS